MKRIFLVLLLLLALPVKASHIVGGEFEIVHLSGNTYRINLILYFDLLNGAAGARDLSATARIFRKSDNRFMRDVFLPLTTETEVAYTQPECSNNAIKTSKLTYTTNVQFSDNDYNDPKGYYIVWERCCRNYNNNGLLNIVSAVPPPGVVDYPQAAGQTFYLEFPPVVKDGKPFINSTPQLFPPLNDYACPSKFYYADFAGKDADGDSLVYTLVTPYNTHTAEAVPASGPKPAPFPEVLWRSPFNLGNIIGGAPDLKISTDGLLTVTPTVQGLFVFAVRCEEFREGVKLGEVRRDFQMLVVDQCSQGEAPQILGKKLQDGTFAYDEEMVVTFSNTTPDADRCIEVQVSDNDINLSQDEFKEKVTIKAVPLGFKKDVSGVLPAITSVTLTQDSPTKTFRICFADCPFMEGPFTIGIVAFDDACSLPYFDTLKVLVNIEPPTNHNAQFITPDVTATVDEGTGVYKWTIDAEDLDGDIMDLVVIPGPGVNLGQAGMSYKSLGQTGNILSTEFSWDPRCDIYNFTGRSEFTIRMQVEDRDHCGFKHPDIFNMKLKVKLPGNHKPRISSQELTAGSSLIDTVNISRKINESLIFHVNGKDDDLDNLILTGTGKGFAMADYNITFPQVTGAGNITSLFTWNITCDKVDLAKKNSFTFHFLVTDYTNKCRFQYDDTLVVNVKVLPPDNTAPELTATSVNPELLLRTDNTMQVTLGQPIDLELLGIDRDRFPQADLLRMELLSATGTVQPQGYSFSSAPARGTVPGVFTWNPQCEIFENGVYENDYVFTFRVYDDKCFSGKADTIDVKLKIKDIDGGDTDFLPPNVITPNGDLKNDFFAMVKRDESTGELLNILPLDNCSGHFERVLIFNRWGRRVYENTSRDFRWFAEGEVTGIYFYQLHYSHKEYRGAITVSFDENQSR
jgi:hypothetical protein